MRERRYLLFVTVFSLIVVCVYLATGLGSQQGKIIFDARWFNSLFTNDNSILLHLRLPRVLAALIVGSALSTSGQLLQSATKNPLADPYLLGVAGGAGLFVVSLHAFFPQLAAMNWGLIPLFAFIGGSVSILFVLAIAKGSRGRISLLSLILAGVVINALCAALINFMLARFDPFSLRITSVWLYGGLGYIRWSQLLGVSIAVFVLTFYARSRAHDLNTFGLGLEGAKSLGVDAERLLLKISLVASALAALGVSLAGLLGYIGLIVPHITRILIGRDLRTSIFFSSALGALLLVVSDTAARILFAPEELPVGVLTAILGCPVLVWQLKSEIHSSQQGRAS